MYAYSLGYFSYEESPEYILLHEQEFSTEEFYELVAEAAEAVVCLWLETPVETPAEAPRRMVSSHYWLSPLEPRDPLNQFRDITAPIACWLIENKGFSPVEPRATARFDGWARLLPDLDGFRFVLDVPANAAVSDRISQLSARIKEKNARIRDLVEANDEDEEEDA